MFVFLSSTQSYVLNLQLGISDGLGDLVGQLGFYDELLSIIMVIIWGVVADLYNIKVVYCSGFVFISAGLFLYTLPTTFPLLVLVRLVFAIGGAGCTSMLTAYVSSHSDTTNRGRYGALTGIFSGLGAVCGALFLLRLPTLFNSNLLQGTHYAYYTSGILALLAGVAALFLPKTELQATIGNLRSTVSIALESLKSP